MQEARAIMVGTSEPASPASPETGKSGREDDAIADLQPIAAEETAKEKAERLAKERSENLKEWGGKASLGTLFSLATCTEKLVLLIGIIGALGHGAGKPLLCLMFGNLIDGMGSTQFTIPIANLTTEEYQALANDSMMSQVGEIAVKFILIGAGVLVAATMQGFGFSWFAAHQVTKMRPLYFDAMLHRDVGWFDTHSPGALPGEMASDLDQFAEGFGNKLGVAVMSLSGLITGLTVGFTLSWQISLLMLVTLPLMALGAVLMASAVKDAMQQVQGPYEKAAALADEMLFAIRTVVAFGGEARELKRYGAATDLAKRGGRLRLSI